MHAAPCRHLPAGPGGLGLVLHRDPRSALEISLESCILQALRIIAESPPALPYATALNVDFRLGRIDSLATVAETPTRSRRAFHAPPRAVGATSVAIPSARNEVLSISAASASLGFSTTCYVSEVFARHRHVGMHAALRWDSIRLTADTEEVLHEPRAQAAFESRTRHCHRLPPPPPRAFGAPPQPRVGGSWTSVFAGDPVMNSHHRARRPVVLVERDTGRPLTKPDERGRGRREPGRALGYSPATARRTRSIFART